jgi:hypothetical protein
MASRDRPTFGFARKGQHRADGESPKPMSSFGKPKAADGEEGPKIGSTDPNPPAGGIQDPLPKPISLWNDFQLPALAQGAEGAKGLSLTGKAAASGFGLGFKPKG